MEIRSGVRRVCVCVSPVSLTSTRFFKVMISRGRWRNRFLCSSSDLRLVRRAMLAGSISIRLSHSVNPCRWCKVPTLSGTSVSRLPPNDNTCKLNFPTNWCSIPKKRPIPPGREPPAPKEAYRVVAMPESSGKIPPFAKSKHKLSRQKNTETTKKKRRNRKKCASC